MQVSSQFHASAALPQWQNPGTHWVGDWLGPRVGMDILERKKFLFLTGIKPGQFSPYDSRCTNYPLVTDDLS
jgi:hypothetical protein